MSPRFIATFALALTALSVLPLTALALGGGPDLDAMDAMNILAHQAVMDSCPMDVTLLADNGHIDPVKKSFLHVVFKKEREILLDSGKRLVSGSLSASAGLPPGYDSETDQLEYLVKDSAFGLQGPEAEALDVESRTLTKTQGIAVIYPRSEKTAPSEVCHKALTRYGAIFSLKVALSEKKKNHEGAYTGRKPPSSQQAALNEFQLSRSDAGLAKP